MTEFQVMISATEKRELGKGVENKERKDRVLRWEGKKDFLMEVTLDQKLKRKEEVV